MDGIGRQFKASCRGDEKVQVRAKVDEITLSTQWKII